jgi:predicted short-subunit dehydrogenase-like oxidoreductase (DUF2520 family)
MRQVGIIGGGRIGTGLSIVLNENNAAVTVLNQGNHALSEPIKAIPGITVTSDQRMFLQSGEIFILAVRDEQINSVEASLPWPEGTAVFHCSGAIDSSVLQHAAARGCPVGSLHFVTSVVDPVRAAEQFRSVPVVCEGAARAVSLARELTAGFAEPFIEITPEKKGVHHLACMFTVNFLSALLSRSGALWSGAGIGEENQNHLSRRLLQDYVDNLAGRSPAETVSGPLVRRDFQTIAGHLQRLDDFPDAFGDDFRYFCMRTAETLQKTGRFTNDAMQELLSLLAQTQD